MKKIVSITLLIVVVALSSLTLQSFKYAASGTDVAIIINSENPISTMPIGQVKLMWLRKIKKRWPDFNKNIRPADRKSKCAERDVFYDKVLGMKADDVESYFSQKQYQNAEKPQDKFGSDADVINFVASEPGAIGFVNASSLTADAKTKVKVVLTVQ